MNGNALLFLRKQEVFEIHARQIELFGGTHGLRNEGALESAPQAAENRAYYEQAGLAICAATYAYHLSQAHAFIDGNKRVAAAVAEIFVELNGANLSATNEEIVELFLSIAASEKSREDVEKVFTQWLVVGNQNKL
jgi:death-on-curing protein